MKKLLLQQARTAYWKKWAARHDYEETKAEPAPALLRKNARGERTEKLRNERDFDTGRPDESQCQACHVEDGMKSGGRFGRPSGPSGHGSKKGERRGKCGSGKEVSARTLSVKANGMKALFCMTKWESREHKSWGMPAEGFKGHVATDGSLS